MRVFVRPLFHPRNLAGVLTLGVLLVLVRDLFFPFGFRPSGPPVEMLIPPGRSLDAIARDLEHEGLIRSPFGFALLARATGVDRVLKAGQYQFRRGEPVLLILNRLTRGMTGLNLVGIPEGLTFRDVGRILERRGIVHAAADFNATCVDTALLRELGVPGPTFEGYLFPSTYDFLHGSTPATVVRRMVAETHRVLAAELAAGSPIAHELTPHELLTLASIVEAEAVHASERERIAAVYLNRLRRGMKLQADPTVAYALGGWRARIFYSDLLVDSPYNTYRNYGLPPGPIGNPGRAAVHAVLHPMPGSRELYFVARGDASGTHIFSETAAAHEVAVRRFRAARAARERALRAAEAESVFSRLLLPAERAGLESAAPDGAGDPSPEGRP